MIRMYRDRAAGRCGRTSALSRPLQLMRTVQWYLDWRIIAFWPAKEWAQGAARDTANS